MCQCPERGDLHFYSTLMVHRKLTNAGLCQCPEWGDLHFYSKDNDLTINWNCVNALNGATFISTLASGNPHK